MHGMYPELAAAVRMLTALVFLSAAVAKLRNLGAFEGVVGNYRLLPEPFVRPAAYVLPPVELIVALAVFAGAPAAQFAAAGLLALFAAAMAVNILRGRSYIDCGCFSSALKQPLRWALVMRNLGMAIVLVLGSAASAPALDSSTLLGTLCGMSLFVLVQCANALLAIPAMPRRRAPAEVGP